MHRYCLISLLFFGQSILIQSVQAQMYQWVDPESGTTQLSGKPPVWYRSAEGGPRIFVFNQGKIVDDTGIEIANEQRISLRTKAFVNAEKDRLEAREKAIKAAKLKAAMQRNADDTLGQDGDIALETGEIPDESQDELVLEIPDEGGSAEKAASEDEASVEKMRALIAEWENKRTEEAKAILEQNSN